MDVRDLKYFVAAVEQKSIIKASKSLHVTQPTVSRTLIELEESLGVKLLNRGARELTLTPEGDLLYQNALTILDLVKRTESKLKEKSEEDISGTICLAMGETPLGLSIAKIIKNFNLRHPKVKFDLVSGNDDLVTMLLDNGNCDFGLLVGSAKKIHYHSLTLPGSDPWGIIVREDDPLAKLFAVKASDLKDKPLIMSKQTLKNEDLSAFFGSSLASLKIVATYSLAYNAKLLCKAGMGVMISLKDLVSAEDSGLVFVPLSPAIGVESSFVWGRGRILSPSAAAFLESVKQAWATHQDHQ